jgi:acetolactate synthase-1/2/3 large subunit
MARTATMMWAWRSHLGSGSTNAVTGIATAYMDTPHGHHQWPVPTAAIGLDAFKNAINAGITRPIVKHNFLVKDRATWLRP